MALAATIQQAITGEEELGDLSQPTQALAQFYRAFNLRDLALMQQNWDDSGEEAMANPLGGIRRGWPEIRKVYERIFSAPGKVEVEFYDYTLHRIGDIFYAVGRERGQAQVKGQRLDLAIRTTRVFRWSAGRWRQIHHHGSFEDANLLASYQAAVR